MDYLYIPYSIKVILLLHLLDTHLPSSIFEAKVKKVEVEESKLKIIKVEKTVGNIYWDEIM